MININFLSLNLYIFFYPIPSSAAAGYCKVLLLAVRHPTLQWIELNIPQAQFEHLQLHPPRYILTVFQRIKYLRFLFGDFSPCFP